MPLPRTALDRYLRLEATGIWRDAPGAQPREVIVSFGRTTLMLRDSAERPLAHWALAGTHAIDVRDGATIFATGPETGETLAIRDRDMIEAIAAVSRAAERARPRVLPPAPRPVNETPDMSELIERWWSLPGPGSRAVGLSSPLIT